MRCKLVGDGGNCSFRLDRVCYSRVQFGKGEVGELIRPRIVHETMHKPAAAPIVCRVKQSVLQSDAKTSLVIDAW